MAANLPTAYYTLQSDYSAAKSREEKIRILEAMLGVIPKHKCSQKVIGEIRRKISLLRKEMVIEAKKKKGAARPSIKKEGAAQVVLLGPPNVGKSYLLNALCNKNIASTELPFETKTAEVGMLNYKGVLIQMIEIPSIYKGFYEKKGEFRGIIFTADALCFVIRNDSDLQLIKSEIDISNRPYIVITSNDANIPEKIWNMLGLIKVFTKVPGKPPEKRPVALRKGSTVELLGNEIHKHFVERLKYAKIIRNKSNIRERQVGLNFVLEDEDIVEFHTT
ncbi:MAG: 50S ribosome-binding GTPase [Candidatus Nanoarchaeia archaeon]|nr:50S ribosome-binding GTPase [Candidatus Nanoarchaeia archaeon]MDD5239461.1 50S ribosome-binding GTPase [Candidatus Nanoarchaeia archaeon]